MDLVQSHGMLFGSRVQPDRQRDYPDLDQPSPRRPHLPSVGRSRGGRIFEGLLGRMGGTEPSLRDIVERLMTTDFHDLAGVPSVAEDPIAQSELAALTRRYEQAQETAAREFGIVKSDLTAVRLQVGNLDQKVSGLDEKVNQLAGDMRGLHEKLDRNQAQVVELLSALVGKNPDES
ncbi:hypothetical protein [Streptomyces nigrescens]|uniref:hypothetical protein n=1 Tax=Streptomyces nigrescens TaxID=1920 RepID=UPI003470116D